MDGLLCAVAAVKWNKTFFNVDCESFHRQEVSRMTWATSTDEIWGSVLRVGQGSPGGDSLGLRGSISLLNEEKRDSQMLGTEQVLAAGEPSDTRGQQWADWQVKKKKMMKTTLAYALYLNKHTKEKFLRRLTCWLVKQPYASGYHSFSFWTELNENAISTFYPSIFF